MLEERGYPPRWIKASGYWIMGQATRSSTRLRPHRNFHVP
ncbi:hypothetical protein SS05631_b55370 (plasmid) [Sinorhizobium sp. CCBAU 05631]|nr:hypothetical protein SS05631_b55370 [Sinorhizobium sp. CCBAU 05631]